MSNIQTTLDALQPYVIGVRFLKGTPLVDVVLNEGWTVLDDPKIKRVKGDDQVNYHMIFSEDESIGLDELLAYVDRIIKANLDRERKHDLLKIKVNELKEVFKKTSLTKLQRLKFSFGEEEFDTSITDIDIDEPTQIFKQTDKISPIKSNNTIQTKNEEVMEEPIEEEINDQVPNQEPDTYLDENKQLIPLSDEDREILEEEARAKRNRELIAAKKEKEKAGLGNMSKKIELPPKRKVEVFNEYNELPDCDCGPDKACSKCIDKKDY